MAPRRPLGEDADWVDAPSPDDWEATPRPYVSRAKRRALAAEEGRRRRAAGEELTPVRPPGRELTTSFWGRAWCANLQRYSDFATRLAPARTDLRRGAVIDLKLQEGGIKALVQDAELYEVSIRVAPLSSERWERLRRECGGRIPSLVELLGGRLSREVMALMIRPDEGLFPVPSELEMACGCPDWAKMCQHVAAALYGVGVRLDDEPAVLFRLRGVQVSELVAGAAEDLKRATEAPAAEELDGLDLGALFGIDLA